MEVKVSSMKVKVSTKEQLRRISSERGRNETLEQVVLGLISDYKDKIDGK